MFAGAREIYFREIIRKFKTGEICETKLEKYRMAIVKSGVL